MFIEYIILAENEINWFISILTTNKKCPSLGKWELSFLFLCPCLGQSLSKIKYKTESRHRFLAKRVKFRDWLEHWDSSVRHLVLLSVICVKIYRNIQILEYRFDIGRTGNKYNSLTSLREVFPALAYIKMIYLLDLLPQCSMFSLATEN